MEPQKPEISQPSADPGTGTAPAVVGPQPGGRATAGAVPLPGSAGADNHAALGLGADPAKPPPRLRKKHLVVLAGLALAVAAGTFIYGRVHRGPASRPEAEPTEMASNTLVEPPAQAAAPAAQDATPRPESRGASWPLAEQAYEATHYGEAYSLYGTLLRESDKNPVNRRVGGLLRLRSGRCLVYLNRAREARPLLLEAAECGSPIVRAMACYELGNLDVAEGQPMTARIRAYQGMASLGDTGPKPRLEMQLEFLAAQALTSKALSFASAGAPRSWNRVVAATVDPFSGLNEVELKKVLDEGSARQASTLLGPVLQRKAGGRGMHLWTAVSCGATLEDVSGRIVSESGLDVRWENVSETARRRPVVLSLDGVNDNRLIEIICGAAGLVARFTGKEAVISDPQAYTSMADLKDLSVRESISLWRRFFMRSSDTPSLASGHFAMAQLQELANDGAAAMAEYQIIAREYPMNALAPVARQRAAVILIDLRDYKGAREALLDLLNHYPDFASSDEVYLRLGQATMEAGNLDEAAATFKKLFFMDSPPASKAGASLGAAKAYFRKGQYEDTAAWLAHRLELPRSPATDGDMAEVYSLLARTEAARRRLPEAVQAYKHALAFIPRDDRQVEVLLELVAILTKQEDFVAAYGILDKLKPQNLGPVQADEILLAKADVLHSMGLPDQTVGMLKARIPSASSPEAAARMTILMARALADSGDLDGARARLTDLLPRIEAGPVAHRAAIELAKICLRGGRNPQAITLCKDLLKSSCSEDIRQSARDALSRAYRLEKDYERAVVVLSEAEPPAKGADKP
ncbi:MAG: tetratricopeptide repeat protein [Planctomycetota bacterium]|nr:tetratricopeptide repeat protein [Planctomycetota bacterium]